MMEMDSFWAKMTQRIKKVNDGSDEPSQPESCSSAGTTSHWLNEKQMCDCGYG